MDSTVDTFTNPGTNSKGEPPSSQTLRAGQGDGLDEIQSEFLPHNPALPAARKEPHQTNVSAPERILSLIAGTALITYGLRRGGWQGISLAVTGGGLTLRSATGYCAVYEALGINTEEETPQTKGVHVEAAITIDRPIEDLYAYWRNFENQPLISSHIQSVTITGEKTSHWVAEGPGKKLVIWDAELIQDIPNERLTWKTLPGSEIDHAGTIRFKAAPGDRGTEVRVSMQYYPPSGSVGAAVAKLFKREPSLEAADALKRFKRIMETGEVVKTDGQAHGQSLQRTAWNPKS